jgi:hypothetical protein
VDVDYGQWGLELLSPRTSVEETAAQVAARGDDYRPTDVVIGRFLGDQDRLVVDAAGSVLVATPLDRRPDWYEPAPDVAAFLRQYVLSSGDKFWERPQRS